MKRAVTTVTLTVLVALFSTSHAADRKGELALGFSSDDAPVAARYFTSDVTAVDFGIGFDSSDVPVADGGTETASDLFVEGGFTYVLHDRDDSFFYVRPAIAFASFDDLSPTGLDNRFRGELNLGAEVRLVSHFGLTFEHGLVFQSDSPQGDGDSLNTVRTFGENVTSAGVWYTF